ncbi:MAG: IS110 family transposase [Desulfomonilaceae bacterium]
MEVYAAIDLHASNSFLAVVDREGKRVFKRRLVNDSAILLNALEPYKEGMQGIAVESTFNWYWVVDAMMGAGYKVHLANPTAIQKYSGMKHSDDNSDAVWLAEMLRLGILPEGYIYPREERSVRDLLRKRTHLVKLRTSLINSLQNIVVRNTGAKVRADKIKQLTNDLVSPLLEQDENLAVTGQVSKQTIDFLTRQIKKVEKKVQGKIELKEEYSCLNTIPGVGSILSFTIMLETGPISRFPAAGNYASYCRKVPTRWTSTGKSKGSGNKKNGNKYLAWAFSEASELARRFDPAIRAWYDRKVSRTSRMCAHSALGHKLARAAYYIMRDQVPFDNKRLIG